MNRVPIPMSRDISGLNDIIIKCKRDRLKSLDPRNDRPAPRSELNVSAIVPHGSSDPSIKRGNLRSMGNLLYKSADHLYKGGNLQRVPMLRRGSLTILNPLPDVTLSVRGEVIDNVGQGSPWNMHNRIEDMNVSRGEIIDNVGQQSPWSGLYGINNMNASWGEIIDIVGQQSPRSGLYGIDNMNASRGEIIDNDGQRSLRSNPCENYDMNVF